MAAISQQLPTAQLREPLTMPQRLSFSQPPGDERVVGRSVIGKIANGAAFIDLGPLADGWTDRVSPRPAATSRPAAPSLLFRFRGPSDEALELASLF